MTRAEGDVRSEKERGLQSKTRMAPTTSSQKAKREPQPLIGLVGQQDEPTDAVREYCAWLASALSRRGVTLETAEVAWDKHGWARSLWRLWKESSAWQGCWILVQFTWLMWGRRGFPVRLLLILTLLKAHRAKIAMVFHDSGVGSSKRGFNRVRLAVQKWVMRRAYQWTDRSLFTVPLDRVTWLPSPLEKACFIPVGANVPSLDDLSRDGFHPDARVSKIVAVFGVSDLPQVRQQEVQAIAYALGRAAGKFEGLRLLVMGRGAKEAEPLLRQTLNGTSVALEVRGLLSPLEVSSLLASSDVMLFVRGPLSSRRGSGVAGIACGVPIVAYRGEETGPPVTEAGVTLVRPGDLEELAQALITTLRDQRVWKTLHARNLLAYREHFCWNAIADRVLEALRDAWMGAACEDDRARGQKDRNLVLP